MLYLLLIPVSYIVFVFISESLNPFHITTVPTKRRRWRLGRVAALITLTVGLLCLIVMDTFQLEPRLVLAVFLTTCLTLMLPSVVKYRRKKIWQ